LGWVGLGPIFSLIVGWVGLGQSADGMGWVGSHKMDPWTTLVEIGQVKGKTSKVPSAYVCGARKGGNESTQ